MNNTPEQLIELGKTNIDTATRAAAVVMEGAESLLKLQLEATKSVIADSAANAKALSSVKDPQELMALSTKIAETNLEKALGFSRNWYEVSSQIQTELTKMAEEQIGQFNKNVVSTMDKAMKNAPAGSEAAVAAVKSAVAAATSAIDTMTKTAKQVADMTDASMKAATAPAAAPKKAAAAKA